MLNSTIMPATGLHGRLNPCSNAVNSTAGMRAGCRPSDWTPAVSQTGSCCPPCQGIYDTLKECAAISKSAGGIGLSIHNIRAVGSYIRGTNGTSNGIVPMLRVFNDTARSAGHVASPWKGKVACLHHRLRSCLRRRLQ